MAASRAGSRRLNESDPASAETIFSRGYRRDTSTRAMAMEAADLVLADTSVLDLAEPDPAEFWRVAEVEGLGPELRPEAPTSTSRASRDPGGDPDGVRPRSGLRDLRGRDRVGRPPAGDRDGSLGPMPWSRRSDEAARPRAFRRPRWRRVSTRASASATSAASTSLSGSLDGRFHGTGPRWVAGHPREAGKGHGRRGK